jgi:hypothetical protein
MVRELHHELYSILKVILSVLESVPTGWQVYGKKNEICIMKVVFGVSKCDNKCITPAPDLNGVASN